MKPMLEAINVATNTSFKIETYSATSYCESTGWHIHPEFELVYVKNGSGQLHIGSKKRQYTNGVLVLLGGNIPHADFGNKDFKDNLEVVVQFKKDFLEERLKAFPELEGVKQLIEKSRHVLIFDEETKNIVSDKFENFHNLENQGKLVNLLSIFDYLSTYGVSRNLFDTIPLNKYRKDEIWRLEQAFEYVNGNYNKIISVMEISAKLGLTPNSFCRFFKKMTHRNFIDFVNEFRIEKAIEHFNANNTVIAEAMYKSGFNDPSYFTRQFKRYQGITPTNYLKLKYGESS
ncbi:putative HTH-type transcriptional regulator YdeC [Flagellimonas maritima]|uniref:Putative HTH-type transcriptional regulator YdeC n=1 Tax=Flagellimonas maritima TaxID=1383885 RepID=A0A2Z4LU65_9FLAO|nr:AraC family transcriptional regulator [Allomuricauda aurantiaca]AWX45376.1 putative HTH-type transcriptional regulator YdeC [Allomuricauda aurantiaca]